MQGPPKFLHLRKTLASKTQRKGHEHAHWAKSLEIYPRMMLWMHPWCAFMAEMEILTRESVKEGAEAVPQRCARRSSGGFSGERRLEGKGAGRKKNLPRSPIYRGGVVTGAVTTPPGSPAPRQFGGFMWLRRRVCMQGTGRTTGSPVQRVRGI